MKKNILLFSFCILFCTCIAQNIIPNGGFDQGPDWSVEMKDHWPIDSICNLNDSVYLAGPDYWYSYGDAALRMVYGHPFIECTDNIIPASMPSWIVMNDYDRVGVNLTNSLKPGYKYHLSYYVKIDSVTAAWFPIYGQMDTWTYFVLNNNGNIIQSPTINIQNNLHTWQQYDTVFTATVNSDVFEIWGTDTIIIETNLLFDNFELSEITSVGELQAIQQPSIYFSQDKIVIENYNYEEYYVSVYNVTGNCIYSNKKIGKSFLKIPSSYLNKGIYLVTVQSNNLMYSKKVLIN